MLFRYYDYCNLKDSAACMISMYRIAGNFRMVQIFVYFVCACCVRK